MFGNMDWAPLLTSFGRIDWTTVLVALVTGMTAAGGPVLLWYKQGQKEREGVRAALLAEVRALVEIIECRGYLSSIRQMEAQLAASRPGVFEPIKPVSLEIMSDSNFNRIYIGNVERLGVLSPDEASQIVRFYQLVGAFNVDVSPGGALARGVTCHLALKETGDLLELFLEIGRRLAATDKRSIWRGRSLGKK